MAKANRITRNAVRQFLQGNSQLKEMRLADMQIFPGEDLACLVVVSDHHLVYEVDLAWHDGAIGILDMSILVKMNEKPERFQYIGKEVR